MANLTEEELNNVSKILDISKDLLRNMTEEDLLLEFETALQKVKLESASETEKINLFRAERSKLCKNCLCFFMAWMTRRICC